MKAALVVAFFSTLLTSTNATGAQPAPSPYASSQPGLEISAQRGQTPDSFEITAVVSDTSNGKVLASPKMTVLAGQWAQASIGSNGKSGPGVSISATVDPSGTLVAYLVEASQADGDLKTYTGAAFVSP